MLSDRERRTLREIHRQMVVDDPDFERSFRTLAAGPPDPTAMPPAQLRWAYTGVIVIAILLATVSLLAGSVGGTLAFSVIAGAVWFAQRLEKAVTERTLDD
ncbi:DUF3040 domain-containing protein [Actinophytocola algeriensis]|uniref:DUF3040 family protein n=1 Tax=Actinophytocola algeriensis TaxID=1768010 RepID=A0A7W7Q341_9PSEU|nr:DUF3040 domain-containing protein [Actinophytocola algeriensis]MBB4906052.1 hypothetical protein [Actinophytocola algeriensis]MBE1472263.1 hypothetical protein [Actinophytocola algeriensis]